MKRIVIGLLVGCIAAGAALAQDGAIKRRQALMGQNGESAELITKMLKGEVPYDATKVAAAMTAIGGTTDEFITLFPEGTAGTADKKGNDAKPEIWQNKADFAARAMKLKQDSGLAVAAAAGGAQNFLPVFAELGKTCQGCHEKYQFQR